MSTPGLGDRRLSVMEPTVEAHPPRLTRILVFALALAPFAFLVGKLSFLCDDAFISFRYSQNFARGLGLRYNLGVEPPVEGYSNFLWVLWMAIFERLEADSAFWSRATSIACGVFLLWHLTRFLQTRLALRPELCAATALFFSTLPPIAVWSTGGMAMVPFTLCAFATFERLLGDPERPKGVQAGILAVVTALLRTDGALIVVLILAAGGVAWMRHRSKELRRALVTVAITFLVCMTIYLGWPPIESSDLIVGLMESSLVWAIPAAVACVVILKLKFKSK